MGRRGPKPKPAVLDRLDGGASHRKRNRREVTPPVSDATCPAWLRGDPTARAIWNAEAPRMITLGLLTTVDRIMFGALCERAAVYQRATTTTRDSLTQQSGANGNVKRPEVEIAKGALDTLVKIAGAFGMTPADRSRLEVELGAGGASGGSGGAGGTPKAPRSLDDFIARRTARLAAQRGATE